MASISRPALVITAKAPRRSCGEGSRRKQRFLLQAVEQAAEAAAAEDDRVGELVDPHAALRRAVQCRQQVVPGQGRQPSRRQVLLDRTDQQGDVPA